MTELRRVLLLLAVASTAAGLDLTTFRESYARTVTSFLAVQTGWQGNWSDSGNVSDERNTFGLQPYFNWASIMRSDASDFTVWLGTQVALDADQEILRNPTYSPNRDFDLVWTAEPELTWRAYLFHSDAFVQVSGDLSADFERRSHDDSSAAHQRTTAWEGTAIGGVAVGYGRRRDAWPLAQAAYVEEVLRNEGVLAHSLSDDDLRELAGFISRAWKLFYAHDYYSRYYYDSLSSYLRKTGAVDRLPAYVLFRLGEWQAGDFDRPFGWRVYGELSGSGNGQIATSSAYGTTSHDKYLSGTGNSSVHLAYARPLKLRTIVTGELEYTLPWPVVTSGWHSHGVTAAAQARYTVTDRLSASLEALYGSTYAIPYEHGLTRQFGRHGEVQTEIRYYLADRFWVSGSAGWSASGEAYYDAGDWHRRVPATSAWLGAGIRWGPNSPFPRP